MAEMKVKQFGKLVKCIKETGRWIEENAEDVAPNVEKGNYKRKELKNDHSYIETARNRKGH